MAFKAKSNKEMITATHGIVKENKDTKDLTEDQTGIVVKSYQTIVTDEIKLAAEANKANPAGCPKIKVNIGDIGIKLGRKNGSPAREARTMEHPKTGKSITIPASVAGGEVTSIGLSVAGSLKDAVRHEAPVGKTSKAKGKKKIS